MANSVGEVTCANKFAVWWSDAETMITTLENQVFSADGRKLDMVRDSWDVLRKEYAEYKISVSNMQRPSGIV
jgi:hypothetical protein